MTLVDKTMNLQAQSVDKSPILQGRASMTEIDARSPEFVAWFATGEFSREYKKYGHQEAALVAWQASRQQALEEAAKWLDFYDGPGKRRAEHIRSLTTTGDK